MTVVIIKPLPRSSFWQRLWYRQRVVGYLFVAPSLLFLFIFVIVPIIGAAYLSLHRYDLIQPPEWRGFDNYLRLLSDERFFKAVRNTFLFALGTVPTGTAVSLLLAVLVNQKVRGIIVFRTALYMPVVTSFVAVSMIWLWLYEPQFGLLNFILTSFGFPRLGWLREPETALLSIIIFSVWKNIGYNMVIYLAGLQSIPEHLYEAASIDGASDFAKFWSITLPLLSPTTFFVVVVWFIGALQMFVQVWVLTQGGPLDSTITVVYLVYSNAFEYLKMGYAAAMSFVLFLLIALVTYINTRLLRYDIVY